MPRPGPRPYECVRRAWHSERHQPLRGSIIQQIFRVVTEAHTPATKKNKEWQEKLPVVVLKAEEIMYSKANSEAEYMNSDTLWDRLNDAVNTIIRRDESTETGDLLPPCVEAALNLGCKPVRTSRSDRHNNPRTYLGPRPQQPPSGSPKPVVGNPLNYAKVTTSALSPNHVSDSNQHVHQNSKPGGSGNYPYSFPPSQQQPLTMEAKPTMNMGSVYPLYYGGETREPRAQVRTTVRDNTSSDMIFVGRPVITPVPEPSGIGLLENSPYGRFQHVANRIVQETALGTQESPGGECDLSLRLGQCLHPCASGKSSSASEIDGVGLGLSQEGNKYSHMPLQRNRELFLYPRGAGYGTIDSSSRGNVEGEDQNLEAMFRKRKAPLANNEEDGQFCRHLGVPSNRFTGRPGS